MINVTTKYGITIPQTKRHPHELIPERNIQKRQPKIKPKSNDIKKLTDIERDDSGLVDGG